MHRSSKIYKDTANIVANPREVEANLLYQSASRLQAIQDHWEEKASELRDASAVQSKALDDLSDVRDPR